MAAAPVAQRPALSTGVAPPADDGLFGPESVTWRLFASTTSALAGTAAGLLADRLDVRLLYGAFGMLLLGAGLLTLWLRGADQRLGGWRSSPAQTAPSSGTPVGVGIAAGD